MIAVEQLSIIVAMGYNRLIGKEENGTYSLPWPNIPEDMRLFRDKTEHHVVIMGRNTSQSIPRKYFPLSNRVNVIVSKTLTQDSKPDGLYVAESLDAALNLAKDIYPEKKRFVIGGAMLYAEAISRASEMLVSWIPGRHAGQLYFPEFDLHEWNVAEHEAFPSFQFVRYVR